ncbi:polysaccharide pyruvyl transferase family protein, partial [uncultured Akkermansia sp.]
FIEQEIHSLSPIFLPGELNAQELDFDAYLAGSDQIWTSCEPEKLLDFAPAGKRMAYAASAAWGQQSPEWQALAQREFPKFSAISVREKHGVEICRKAGAEKVEVVLDPTLLLDRREYCRLTEGRPPYFSGPCVLGYFLNIDQLSRLPWKQVKEVGKKMRATLRVIPLQGAECCIPEKYSISPDPYEFLQAFQEALCIITNSFHGTVFALIMRKPFITILQKGETAVQNTRIFSLLESLGLEDRIYHPEKGSMAEQLDRPINWTAVERNWEALRIHSMEFLKNAIQQCTSATRHG